MLQKLRQHLPDQFCSCRFRFFSLQRTIVPYGEHCRLDFYHDSVDAHILCRLEQPVGNPRPDVGKVGHGLLHGELSRIAQHAVGLGRLILPHQTVLLQGRFPNLLFLIRDLAGEGCIPAMLYMGNLCWYGRCGVAESRVRSASYYEECARRGNARAQYVMSSNYYYGEGVQVDYELAKMYANLALEQKYIYQLF